MNIILLRTAAFIAAMLALLPCADGRRPEPKLDTSIRFTEPLPCRHISMLPSPYDAPDAPWYCYGKSAFIGSTWPLSRQISALLQNNCSDGAEVSIALDEVKMYYANPVYLYIHAELFSGPPGARHHFYSLDTIVQKAYPWLSRDGDQRIASECVLEAVRAACRHIAFASSATLSDQEAAAFYKNQTKQYPLYTGSGVPPMGLYRTVEDFLALRPNDTPLLFEHIPQMSGEGYNWFYIKTAEGEKGRQIEADEFYAASNGKNLFFSSHGTLHKITKVYGGYFIKMTAKMLAAEGFNLTSALDKSMSKDGQGSRIWAEVVGKFSPQRRRFLPYGPMMPQE